MGIDTARAPVRPELADGPGPPPRTDRVGRRLGRRRSLPGGRALVGGFLVALAGFGLFAAYTSATSAPTTDYAVATRDLALGSRITSSDLTLVRMDLPDSPTRQALFSDPRRLIGRTVVGPVRKGELVQGGDVVDRQSQPAELEVSFSIDTDRALAGGLRPGEEVDVVATFGTGADAFTTVVVRAARILSTDQGRGALTDGRRQTVAVAVSRLDESMALVHAVNAGEVTLVRTGDTDADRPAPPPYRAPQTGRVGG